MNTVIHRKPRYSTKEQILSRIEAERTKAVDLEKRAWECEREAVHLLEESAKPKCKNGAWLVDQAVKERLAAKKHNRRASSIIEKKLPKLKQKLAEFLTSQIPVLDNGDTSIPQ